MRNNEKGFTLVEVLASMVILFIILTTLLGVFAQSATFTKTNEETLLATNLASVAMEAVRTKDWVDEVAFRAYLLEANLIDTSCSVHHLFSSGCYLVPNNAFTLKIGLLDLEAEIKLLPVRLELIHSERKTVLATRYFYMQG